MQRLGSRLRGNDESTPEAGQYTSVSSRARRPLPADVASQLFKPFTTGGRAGGAGLGLCIARDLVRAHGGEIALAETGPQGTTFRFTLPSNGH